MQHYEIFSDLLSKEDVLSEQEIEIISSSFRVDYISKNQFFSEAGQRCKRVGFLNSGILCSYIYNTDGYEVVKHFLEPHQYFTDLESYEKNREARLNIMAVTDSVILSIDKQENNKLQNQIPKWEYVQGLFASRALNNMIQMQNFLHFGSAADKYRHFVENHPNLARHVPLKYIASYLGITQSSLSRLRRENTGK